MNNAELFTDLPLPVSLDACLPVEIEDTWPKLLVDMLQVMQQAYRDAGATVDKARALAIIGLRALASYHGGRTFYLPRGDKLEQALRNWQMWEEFTGKNIGDLCSKYRLTEQMVYQILAEQRAAHTRKIQPGLFEGIKGR
jgi:Mor family transcriptional regulator